MTPLLNTLLLSSALLLGTACSSNNQQEEITMNPFFSTFDTPYGIPNFESIKEEHYVSAMREGMRIQKAEIDEITRN